MKKIVLFSCLFLSALIFLAPIPSFEAHAADRPLLIVGEEFPPFEFFKDNKVVGFDIDVARHIFTKMNIPVRFEIYPWKRAWLMVEIGEADAVLTTSRCQAPIFWSSGNESFQFKLAAWV